VFVSRLAGFAAALVTPATGWDNTIAGEDTVWDATAAEITTGVVVAWSDVELLAGCALSTASSPRAVVGLELCAVVVPCAPSTACDVTTDGTTAAGGIGAATFAPVPDIASALASPSAGVAPGVGSVLSCETPSACTAAATCLVTTGV
jgi:hypothetical protein